MHTREARRSSSRRGRRIFHSIASTGQSLRDEGVDTTRLLVFHLAGIASKLSSRSPFPIHVRGAEGASAEGKIAVAEDPVHLKTLAAVDEAVAVDRDDLGEMRPIIGKRPYTPIKTS